MAVDGDDSDQARSLRSPTVVSARRAMLDQPHIAPLAKYVEQLRQSYPNREFPDFDPLDGGANADLLFLLEKPGPMNAASGKGSGFISRNNDDPTAAAVFAFMKQANIPREQTAIWNIIPGWNGTMQVTTSEVRTGIDALKDLMPLFTRLQTIVLVGRKAQRAEPFVQSLGLRILKSAHPSPQVRASQPETWREIPKLWAQAIES